MVLVAAAAVVAVAVPSPHRRIRRTSQTSPLIFVPPRRGIVRSPHLVLLPSPPIPPLDGAARSAPHAAHLRRDEDDDEDEDDVEMGTLIEGEV